MKTRRCRQQSKQGTQLFNDARSGKPRVKGTGYGSARKARATLRAIRRKPVALQKQILVTMYYRAKHHKYQTDDMRAAMAVFKPAMEALKIHT
jgi:hypothetical protein